MPPQFRHGGTTISTLPTLRRVVLRKTCHPSPNSAHSLHHRVSSFTKLPPTAGTRAQNISSSCPHPRHRNIRTISGSIAVSSRTRHSKKDLTFSLHRTIKKTARQPARLFCIRHSCCSLGALGIGPRLRTPEARVLPLYYAPSLLHIIFLLDGADALILADLYP